MQTNTQIIVHNTYQKTVQSANETIKKKWVTNFALGKQKKTVTTQEKKTTPSKHAYKTVLHGRSM